MRPVLDQAWISGPDLCIMCSANDWDPLYMPRTHIPKKSNCHTCESRHLCITESLGAEDIEKLDQLINTSVMLEKGAYVFHIQDEVKSLYAVYSGSCKEYWIDENGNECVTNFYFPGDLIGLESIANRKHLFSVCSLEPTELCVIPLDEYLKLMQTNSDIMKRFINIASLKMQNDQSITMGVTATELVCDFLMNVIMRMLERKHTEKDIHLPMSQLDISNYLGIAYETVNRVFQKLKKDKIIKLENKAIQVLDIAALKARGRLDYEQKMP